VCAISLIRWLGDQHRPALGGEVLQQVADPADAFGVQAVDRLVEQQDPRVAEQGSGDTQPLRHAERELPGPAVRGLLDAGDGEHLLDPLPADGVAGGQRGQVGAGGAARVERLGLQQRAHLAERPAQVAVALPADPDLSRVRPVQARDHAHRGGLARAVRAEESGHRAGADIEAQVVHRGRGSVVLDEAACLDHRNLQWLGSHSRVRAAGA